MPAANVVQSEERGLAYHAVVRALEARSGMTPVRRLWLSARHALAGHLPYERYHEAGLARAKERTGADQIESLVADWLHVDLNPAVQTIRLSRSLAGVVAGYNAYNEASCLGVRTSAEVGSDGKVLVARRLLGARSDPEPCKLGTFKVLQELISEVRRHERLDSPGGALSLSEVACVLGAEASATAQAAEALEAGGPMSIGELAAELGCGQRTLERRLREEGGTPEALRASTRLVAATRLLASELTLTEIAFEVGYSDAAHMTRSFKAACGMTPSRLRATLSPP